MTRIFTRENVKLAVVAVACLLIAWTGPSIAHGVHAQFAHNADKVDGKHAVSSGASLNKAKKKLVAHDSNGMLPDRFVAKPKEIVTAAGTSGWTNNAGDPVTTLSHFTLRTRATGDGTIQMELHAPVQLGSAKYGLKDVRICYNRSGGAAVISTTTVWGTEDTSTTSLASDPTDQGSAAQTCYTVAVGKRVINGVNIDLALAGGGTIDLYAVRATWNQASASVAPRAGARSGSPATRGDG